MHSTSRSTVSAFARLVGILTGGDKARNALIRSGPDLTLVERQCCEGRDAFWGRLIAHIFNDNLYELELSFTSCLESDTEIQLDKRNTALPQVWRELL